MEKREFIKMITMAGLILPISSKNFEEILSDHQHHTPAQLALDDDFWSAIRGEYELKPEYINLENGYYSVLPKVTLDEYITQIKNLNLQASYYMRTRLANDKLEVRQLMANFLKCPLTEVIITRNTTESMDTVICGIDWKAGDEAIMALQDYGSMLDMFKQQAKRYGMVNKIISIPNHPNSDEEIVALYENAISPKTRLIMVCHMINITGQILPIKKICEMAHRHGVKVLVDGAHALAHIDFNITDLGCDYYASSLHKWLSVPLGAGLLYVKQEHISDLWPLYGDSGFAADDIRKLNHTGTHPMHTELTIKYAIQFHNKIGSKRKEERLRYLQNYWTSQVRSIAGIVVNTPADQARCCGIANVGIAKFKPTEIAKILLDKYKIWTVAINSANVNGCRIAPSVFTTTKELDELIYALKEMNS